MADGERPIWVEALLDAEITAADYRVFTYLYWKQGKNGSAWPSQETMSNDLNISVRTVQMTIKRLEQRGYLHISRPEKQGRGQHLKYVIGNGEKGRTEFHPLDTERVQPASPFTGKRAQNPARKGRNGLRTNTYKEHFQSSSAFSDYWNSKPKLKPIHRMTDERRKKFATRMKEPDFADNWRRIIDKLAESNFCTGGNERKWKADIDWLLDNSTNYVKVLEGKYDDSIPSAAVPLVRDGEGKTPEQRILEKMNGN